MLNFTLSTQQIKRKRPKIKTDASSSAVTHCWVGRQLRWRKHSPMRCWQILPQFGDGWESGKLLKKVRRLLSHDAGFVVVSCVVSCVVSSSKRSSIILVTDLHGGARPVRSWASFSHVEILMLQAFRCRPKQSLTRRLDRPTLLPCGAVIHCPVFFSCGMFYFSEVKCRCKLHNRIDPREQNHPRRC